MNFNKHLDLEGKHALLGASKYNWLNYDDEKLIEYVDKENAKAKGTIYHEFAKTCILLGEKLPRVQRTLNMYINDAIGFKMTPEQPLYYSENCYGTADAISFRKNMLRIHDLKTGLVTKAHIEQLIIYAALFCLEYNIKPEDIRIELRIYQFDEIRAYEPTNEEMRDVMNEIVRKDNLIEQHKVVGGVL